LYRFKPNGFDKETDEWDGYWGLGTPAILESG